MPVDWRSINTQWPRLAVVGPLPPPSGGMANQCEQLVRLLKQEGASVELVRTNAPYWPSWVGKWPVIRAGFRLLPYLCALWRVLGRVDVVHVFANSGWAWHLLAMPALILARWRGVAAIVNYRGGNADQFFATAPAHVLRTLRRASLRVVPSAFLVRVFRRVGLDAEVIPNIIDLSRFGAAPARAPGNDPHLIVTRNLEPIYDIATAIRAFAVIRHRHAGARLTVAGIGPDLRPLQDLAHQLGVAEAVSFPGRIENVDIAALYASADCMLNSSTVDNMPISILESMASGVPVVSTMAGGIPDMVEDGVSALLVPIGDSAAMAAAAMLVIGTPAKAAALRHAGIEVARRYAWNQVKPLWQLAYRQAARSRSTS